MTFFYALSVLVFAMFELIIITALVVILVRSKRSQ